MGRPGSSRGVDYMRGFTWGLQGEEIVMKNLQIELDKIKNGSLRGLVMAAAFIRRQTETAPPLTPVDYGNLRASWFVTTGSGINAGGGNPNFKGPKAAQMGSEHTAFVEQSQAMIKAASAGGNKFVMLGYSANYGGWVHEMIGATFQRPGAGPKWLEAHIKNNASKIVEIVRDNSKVK